MSTWFGRLSWMGCLAWVGLSSPAAQATHAPTKQMNPALPSIAKQLQATKVTKTTKVTKAKSQIQVGRYVGRRISINFHKVEIHNLLRLFAELSGSNIIASAKVKGRISLRLRNVPWDQAFELVLKTLRLGQERQGNIIRVATLNEMTAAVSARQRLLQLKQRNQTQKVVIIPVNYAKAQNMARLVKMVLSPYGKVTVDTRTNTLIVKDYPYFLTRARAAVGR